jgi:HEPN domain-containing protein
MSEHDIVNEWLQIAYEDLDTALFLFEHKHKKPLEIICYHCQQAAEKSLKAYLCASGIEVPKTHEVGLLCHRCNELDVSFSEYFYACDDLALYATQTRYPNRMEIEEPRAKAALEQARLIYDTANQKIDALFVANLSESEEEPDQDFGGMTLQ